jgi:hypothetical protein
LRSIELLDNSEALSAAPYPPEGRTGVFGDGTPEVSEAGGDLAENRGSKDSIVRSNPRIEIGFDM